MDATTLSFYVAAAIATIGALVGVLARRPERALAGLALCGAALVVPLVQLAAAWVAAIELLAVVLGVGLLFGLHANRSGRVGPPARAIGAWLLAGGALLAFVWVLLATGSRQVVETGPTPKRGFGDAAALDELVFGRFMVPLELVGLIALVVLVAAVLAVERRPRPEGEGGA